MAHGQRASQNQSKRRELNSKRCVKVSSSPSNKFSKRVTHKHERKLAKKLIQEQNGDLEL